MKRTLAPEALYSPQPVVVDQFEKITTRILELDPNGDRALALLNEIEALSHPQPDLATLTAGRV